MFLLVLIQENNSNYRVFSYSLALLPFSLSLLSYEQPFLLCLILSSLNITKHPQTKNQYLCRTISFVGVILFNGYYFNSIIDFNKNISLFNKFGKPVLGAGFYLHLSTYMSRACELIFNKFGLQCATI